MNPTPSQPERPEPPKGFRLMEQSELTAGCIMPNDALIWEESESPQWEPSCFQGEKLLCRQTGIYATRTAPEAVAGERKCATCDGTGKLPAMVETATGFEPCPYLAGDDCPDCSPTPPVEADKDAEIARLREALNYALPILRVLSQSGEIPKNGETIGNWEHIVEAEKEVSAAISKPPTHSGSIPERSIDGPRMVSVTAHGEREASRAGSTPAGGSYLSDLTTARATIAERDKRIETLNWWSDHGRTVNRKSPDRWVVTFNHPAGPQYFLRTEGRTFEEAISNAALAHAAEGKEQA